MDPKHVSPIPSPPPTSPLQSQRVVFLITAVIVILGTALLLITLYVIRCFINFQRINRLRRFSFSRSSRNHDTFSPSSPDILNGGGLDQSLIQSIPTYHYTKSDLNSSQCAVCLNEFEEGEILRAIPICRHAFHINCIDVWLHSSANCPLCRNYISALTISHASLQQPNPHDEHYVVIERLNSGDLSSNISISSPSPLQRLWRKNTKRSRRVTSFGDEWIDIRREDEQFGIQPIRRSFSMDSAANRQLYLAVRKIVQQQKHHHEISPGEFSSSHSRINKKSFFSFGYGRGSKDSVQTREFGASTS